VAVKSANSPGIVAIAGDLGEKLGRFRRSLRTENGSPNTVLAYCGAVERLDDFLVGADLPRTTGPNTLSSRQLGQKPDRV
jgi:hypothetical protein